MQRLIDQLADMQERMAKGEHTREDGLFILAALMALAQVVATLAPRADVELSIPPATEPQAPEPADPPNPPAADPPAPPEDSAAAEPTAGAE